MKPLILLLSLLTLALATACGSEGNPPNIPTSKSPETLPTSAPVEPIKATSVATPIPGTKTLPENDQATEDTTLPTATPTSVPNENPPPTPKAPKPKESVPTPEDQQKPIPTSTPDSPSANNNACAEVRSDTKRLPKCYESIGKIKNLTLKITEADFESTLFQNETIPQKYGPELSSHPFSDFFNQQYESVPWQRKKGAGQKSEATSGQAERFLEMPWWRATNIHTLFGANEIAQSGDPTPEEERSNPLYPIGKEIAETIADWMKEQLTGSEWVEPQLRWFNKENIKGNFQSTHTEFSPEIREGDLQKYLQTTAWLPQVEKRNIFINSLYENQYDFRTPLVTWKLFDNNPNLSDLPIVQVTAWNKTNLPYYIKGECEPEEEQCGVTKYAVTFVVAFQDCGEEDIQPYGLLSDILIQIFENDEHEKGILKGKQTIPWKENLNKGCQSG